MIEAMDHLPSTEAAVTALRALAAEYAHEIEVGQTSRRTAAGIGVTTDPDGSLPHEAFAELGEVPRVTVRLFPHDDVPAFLRSVYDGLAFVTARRFPPGRHPPVACFT